MLLFQNYFANSKAINANQIKIVAIFFLRIKSYLGDDNINKNFKIKPHFYLLGYIQNFSLGKNVKILSFDR